MEKYSARGPSVRAGKKDNAAIMIITESNTATNAGLSTFRVPELSGIYFFEASEPAMARGPTIGMNLPKSMQTPQSTFQNGVASVSPSNPEPLFAADDVNSYSISLKP